MGLIIAISSAAAAHRSQLIGLILRHQCVDKFLKRTALEHGV